MKREPGEYFLDDAFLSHSTHDEEFASELVCALEIRNKMIWFAPHRIHLGDVIHIKVEQGLAVSRHLIILLSRRYLDSEWCRMEWACCQFNDPANRKRKIIPVLLEPCDLPMRLHSLKNCDLSEGMTPDRVEEIARMI